MSKSEVPVDWDHFHVLLEGILHRVPSMANAVLERLTNGPEPFSADGNWILGHAPEVKIEYIISRFYRLIINVVNNHIFK